MSLICHDMFQTCLEERRNESRSDIRLPPSNISADARDITAHGSPGAFQGQWTNENIRATPPLSTVPMELVDPELRTDTSSAKHMEGVVTESLSASKGCDDDKEVPKPTVIDEEGDIWEVEALLAKWK